MQIIKVLLGAVIVLLIIVIASCIIGGIFSLAEKVCKSVSR